MIYETYKNLFGTFLDKNRTPAIKKLKKLIIGGKNSYGHEQVYIGEDNKRKIMGILVAFKGDEIKCFEETKAYWNAMNFPNFLKLTLVKPIYDKITASSIDNNDLYIGNLVVSNDLRGQGIGTELLKSSFILGKAKKCNRVLLDVTFENDSAKRLYEKTGFKVCGENASYGLVSLQEPTVWNIRK